MRWFRFALLALLLLTASTAQATGLNGRACGGRTVTGTDACCISGMVTLDGKPVVGAVVTVRLAKDEKVAVSDLTEYVEDDINPTYGFTLHDQPLLAQPGDMLIIAVSYGPWIRELTYQVIADEQWLDIELQEDPSTGLFITQ